MQAGPREGSTWGSVLSWGWWELFAVLQKLVRGSSFGSGCEKPSAPKPSRGTNPHAQPRPLLQDPPPRPPQWGTHCFPRPLILWQPDHWQGQDHLLSPTDCGHMVAELPP